MTCRNSLTKMIPTWESKYFLNLCMFELLSVFSVVLEIVSGKLCAQQKLLFQCVVWWALLLS